VVYRIARVVVKNKNTCTKANCEDSFLYYIDTDLRIFGEQRGLDTLVVQNVNDKSSGWVFSSLR